MPRISVEFDDDVYKALGRRAEKNFLSVKEMIEDIVRRSMVNYVGGPKRVRFKVDDKLVEAFSRERRGRKRKKKNKG